MGNWIWVQEHSIQGSCDKCGVFGYVYCSISFLLYSVGSRSGSNSAYCNCIFRGDFNRQFCRIANIGLLQPEKKIEKEDDAINVIKGMVCGAGGCSAHSFLQVVDELPRLPWYNVYAVWKGK